jgi:NADPH-dependent 7-cyano-7-deazaguanine reductase QueF-like protein
MNGSNQSRHRRRSAAAFSESSWLRLFAAAAIFVLTYAGVLLGRIPSLRLDRSGIALSGAALMFAVGTLIWNLWNSSWIDAGGCRFLF